MASLEGFASLVQEVQAQADTIRLLREYLNEAGGKVIALEQDKEKEKKKGVAEGQAQPRQLRKGALSRGGLRR